MRTSRKKPTTSFIGIVVESVSSGSPGEQAGLFAEDLLTQYDDTPLTSPAMLQAVEENTVGKDSATLRLKRGGEELTLSVPLGSLGVETRLQLSADVLRLYKGAKAALSANDEEKCVVRLEKAAHAAKLEGQRDVSAWLWVQIGKRYEKQNEWFLAQSSYENAESVQGTGGCDADHYVCSLAIGRCGERLNNYLQSTRNYVAALKGAMADGNAIWQASSLNGLGRNAYFQDNMEEALDCFHRALDSVEQVAPSSLCAATSLSNMGVIADHRGDLTSARKYAMRSLHIRAQHAPGSLDVALCLNNLGIVASRLGDFTSAREYYLRSLAIREVLAPDTLGVAFCLNNLGNDASACRDLESAHGYHLRALDIREQLAPDSLHVARSLLNLGEVFQLRGDLALAHSYFLRALGIVERLAVGSLDMAETISSLGLVAFRQRDLSLAGNHYLSALRIRERGAPGSLLVANSLTELGRVYHAQQRHAEELALYQDALAIVEGHRSQIESPHARSLMLAQHLDKYLGLARSYLALSQVGEAYATVERCRARSLVEMMAERRIDFVHDAPEDLRKQQQAVDRQRARTYSSLAELDATNNEQVDALHSQLRDFDRQQQELTARMRQVSPRYASLQYPQPLDLAAAQAALDPGTLALVYQMDEEQTYLFALTANQFELFTLPVGRKAVSDHVRAFRESLDVYALEYSLEQALLQAQALYSQLLEPAEKLTVKAERLLICPDGALHILPWAALGYEFDGKWQSLGAEKPLHTALSLTIYAQTRTDRPAPAAIPEHLADPEQAESSLMQRLTSSVQQIWQSGKRMLAMGDPLYQLSSLIQPAVAAVRSASTRKEENPIDEPGKVEATDVISESGNGELAALRGRGLRLRPLPFTRNEVESIASMFGDQVTLRVGAEATKTNALAECADAAIIHFACHGWLDARQPLSSGLVLAQPEALGENAIEGDNGLLQAWEIFEKVKLNAELVVLSACQTGLGQEVAGEGLIGLTRAFSYAGARSQLVSLWEVNDASTSEFMEAFYRSLKDGNSKDVALQGAIRHMSEHPKWNHPFYWAAFTLHGDWM